MGECEGFDWDDGNLLKSWLKHSVAHGETEQVFFNEPLLVKQDPEHSSGESRYHALGRTDKNRCLFVVFTVRNGLIRVISARSANRKEKTTYEKAQNNP